MSDAFGISGAGVDLPSTLRQTVKAILLAANTLADDQVETSRDEALTGDDQCVISIYTPMIEQSWLGNAPPSFKGVTHLVIVGRLLRKVPLEVVEVLTDKLRVQIQNAVLRSPEFWDLLEQVNNITTSFEFPGAGDQHEGIVKMNLECQATDQFNLIVGVPLQTIGLTVPGPTPTETAIGATIPLPQGT